MEDYRSIREKSEKELTDLRQKEAVIKSKIETLADELGLDKSQPLMPQIEEMKKKLQSELEASNKEVEELLGKLKDLEDE